LGAQLLGANRPRAIAIFETLACIAILLGTISSLIRPQVGLVWPIAFGVVELALIFAISRYRSRAARIVWSGLLTLVWLLALVGIGIFVRRGISFPTMSGLDGFFTVLILGCNLAALRYLWSSTSSKWLKRAPA
jgi:hypothetical protein